MVNNVTVVNAFNEALSIDLSNPWSTGLAIMNIDGLNPPMANIHTADLSSTDGSVFNSARVGLRNITIKFKLLEVPATATTDRQTIEDSRLKLYKYFPLKDKVILFVETDTREAYIEGYIESIEVNIFDSFETAQVSIICPTPQWTALDPGTSETIRTNGPTFEFGFSNEWGLQELLFNNSGSAELEVEYDGDAAAGCRIDMAFHGDLASDLSIVNSAKPNDIFNISYSRMILTIGRNFTEGDTLTIVSYRGRKSMYLENSSGLISLIAAIDPGSVFPTLYPGDNELAFIYDGDVDIEITVNYDIKYEGL